MQQHPARILVIDDEVLIRRALADYLAECDYEATTAADGAVGIAKARNTHFDAVLVDLRMPRVDGLEVIATLKEEQPALPVVVVSGTGVLQDVIAAMRLGAWDYITKPIHDMDEITVVIERVLDRARLIAERDRYQQQLETLNRSLEAEVARRTQDLRARNRDLTVLNHVIGAVTESLDPVRILQVLCHELAIAFRILRVTALLVSPGEDSAPIVAEYCPPGHMTTLGKSIPIGHTFFQHIIKSKQPLFIPEAQTDSRLGELCATMRQHDVKTLLVIPLVAHGQVISLLQLNTETQHAYNDDALNLIQNAATAAAQALATVNLHQELRQHAEDLEMTVAQRTAELRVALEQAQAADRAKSQFLSSVSHELRTPLTSLRLYLGLLKNSPKERHSDYLESLMRETARLQTLIESLLDLSRLDLGKTEPQMQSIDLNALLTTLAADRQTLFGERGLTLHVHTAVDLPPITVDPKLIEQVATNLLTNAMNYTPAGGDVVLKTAVVTDDDQTWATFDVRDNGPGIPQSEQPRLFERFFRGSAGMKSDAPGTGLGLAICKEIVTLHHGHITLESTAGQGSTFTVWLPTPVNA